MTAAASIMTLCQLFGWLIVVGYALPQWWRVLRFHSAASIDFKQVALGVVGVAIIVLRVNALANDFMPRNSWAWIGHILLAAAAPIVIFCVNLPKTPPEHKRALVISHLAIFVACIVGGLIA